MKKKLFILAVACTVLIVFGGSQKPLLFGTQFITSSQDYTYAIGESFDWWDCNWSYCKKIVINHTKVLASQVEFPFLFDEVTDGDLKDHAQSDGDDIVFIDRYNATQYKHELEEYDSSTGEISAWINLPNIYSDEEYEWEYD